MDPDLVDPFEDLPEADRPPAVDKPWGAMGIGHAEDLHNHYVRALEKWDRFESNNASQISLWTAIRDIARHRRTSDSGLSADEVYDALGLEEAYGQLRTAGVTLPDGAPLAFDPAATTSQILLLDAYPERDSIPQISDGDIENNFISFGRKLAHFRSEPERRARRLVNYIAGGEETGLAALIVGTQAHKKGFDQGEDNFNPFYLSLYSKSYAQQITVLRELTHRLGETQTGRRFLASLFELGQQAIINPWAVANPSVLQLREPLDRSKLALHVQTPEDYKAYFDETTGKLRELTGTSADAGLADQLLELLNNLNPGLAYWISLSTEQDGDVVDGKVAEFIGTGIARYIAAEDVQAIDPELSNTLIEIRSGTQGWTIANIQSLGAATSAAGDTILETALSDPDALDAGKRASRARHLTGGLKLLFSSVGMCLIIRDAVKKVLAGQRLSREEMTKGLHGALSWVSDLNTAEVYFSKEVVKRSKVFRASRFVGRFSPLLVVCGIYFSVVDFRQEMEELDYDAAFSVGLMGLGGLLGASATYVAGGALLSPAGVLIAAGTGLFVIGYVLYGHVDDSELETILRFSFFGADWDEGATSTSPVRRGQYEQPEKAYFRFRYQGSSGWNGPPNFNRQLSALASLGRPIGVDVVAFDEDEDSIVDPEDIGGTAQPDVAVGKIHLDPISAVGNVPKDLDVYADGEIYVAPLDIPYSESVSPVAYKIPHGATEPDYTYGYPPLHRIRLGDWYDESEPPATRYHMARTEVPIYEWWSDVVKLRPEHSPTTAAVAPGIDNKVHKWEGKIFALPGQPANAIGHILGFSASAIEEVDCWVEIIYVPPEITNVLSNIPTAERAGHIRKAFEDWPMVSRHRMIIDDEI